MGSDIARRWCAVLLAGLAIAAPAAARAKDTLAQRAELLANHIQYYAPAVEGPAPLVILSSGCGGVTGENGPNPVMNNYAAAAARAGAYAVIVDGIGARGIGRDKAIRSVCTLLRLRGGERAGDILGGEELARRHWGDRFTGVILGGWSHGAWTVMELLSDGPAAKTVGSLRVESHPAALRPDAVVLYYPYCGLIGRTNKFPKWTFGGPLLLVTAERDTIGPAKKCLPVVKATIADPSAVRSVDFAGMTHAFDESMQSPDSKFVYDAEAAAKSEALFSAFIAEQAARLRRAGPAAPPGAR